ncbi:membrane protein US12C [Cercopithecine betaherpesvirus 5]|uniref:Membrane protein US12C n=1 Tax=Simian cytomegalovirus (strain Colburn) TaxID=50292 RepID=G8XTM0_SCMVC|nr:membrane protein US12C [Cercopithecine betaherpesvirus 5]AEV80512.1 membrane protein US12C [Cercopithecine betaherpesvirus 5]
MDAKMDSSLRQLSRTAMIIEVYAWFSVAVAWTVVVYGVARFTFPVIFVPENCHKDPAPALLLFIPVVLLYVTYFRQETLNRTGSWIYSVAIVSVSNTVYLTCADDYTPMLILLMSFVLFITYSACVRWPKLLCVYFFVCIAVAMSVSLAYGNNHVSTKVAMYVMISMVLIGVTANNTFDVHNMPVYRAKTGSLLLYYAFIVIYQMSIFAWTPGLCSMNPHDMFSSFRDR